MIEEQIAQGVDENIPPALHRSSIILILLFAVVVGLLGYWLGIRQSTGPGSDSADAGFVRDMMTHHAQAVDMATIVRDYTEDPAMRQLALDIMLTQQSQIGQMQGWLSVWGYPIASVDPAMSWMGMPGSMPGMATPEQLNQLRDLQGAEADGLFLELMILHHRGGVQMAEAALANAKTTQALVLAQSVRDAQTSEIELMQGILQDKGFPPVPEESGMMHDTTSP